MALLSMKNVRIGFGGPPLLDQVNLQIEPHERICLVGRNGEGKSTLLNLINGSMLPDEGNIIRGQGVRISLLDQEVPHDLSGSVFDVVAGGLEKSHGSISIEVDRVTTLLKLDSQVTFESLSTGLKRRVLFARTLVGEPDLILLDEPTNHLDIDAIGQLEELLLRYKGTLLFVTHDRMFLKKIATRIIEIDRGTLSSWSCNYESFQKRKQAFLEAEAQRSARFDKKLAKEEAWIRKGIKARRTRDEGRVRALKKLRTQRRTRRERTGNVKMQAQEATRTGKLIIEAKDISFSYESNVVIQNFSTVIMRGDKVGIIGPNGSGKTTLIGLLLKKFLPMQGEVRFGTHLEVAYFDQVREQLDEEKTLQDNVADGKEILSIDGKPRHVISYLKNFLFSPERARSPVRTLSGGERNRLLLAKLFTKPANVFVLDEPTNDLDTETLELLEELLLDYQGTVILVSHDRTFLNNVVTSTIVFEKNQKVREYVGGYDDWLRQKAPEEPEKKQPVGKPVKVKKTPAQTEGARKLSYKEQRELDALPQQIETLEKEQTQLYQTMADPDFYQNDGNEIVTAKNRLKNLENELDLAYKRWESLEDM